MRREGRPMPVGREKAVRDIFGSAAGRVKPCFFFHRRRKPGRTTARATGREKAETPPRTFVSGGVSENWLHPTAARQLRFNAASPGIRYTLGSPPSARASPRRPGTKVRRLREL